MARSTTAITIPLALRNHWILDPFQQRPSVKAVFDKSAFDGMQEKEATKTRDMFCAITKNIKQQTVHRIGLRWSRR